MVCFVNDVLNAILLAHQLNMIDMFDLRQTGAAASDYRYLGRLVVFWTNSED